MVVIRPDREGSNKAHTTLNGPKRSRGGDSAQEAAETNRTEDRRNVRRVDSQIRAEQELGESARLTSLLQRAGVGSTGHGDSTSSVQAATSAVRVATADGVEKSQPKTDDLQLGIVQAPRIELTPRLSESALSFVQNIDRAVGNHLVQTAAALNAMPGGARFQLENNVRLPRGDTGAQQQGDGQQRVLTTEEARAEANHNVLVRLVPSLDARDEEEIAERGLERVVDQDQPVDGAAAAVDGAATPVDRGNLAVPVGNGNTNNNGANANTITTANGAKLNTGTNTNAAARERQHRLTATADQVGRRDRGSGALNNASELAARLNIVDMSNLSSDQLLAEFMKLNINDPNANVETQHKLYTLASEMRQQAIEEAKKKIERAQEMMREAQKYADKVEKYAEMASMIGILAAFMGPLGAILSGIMQIAVAVAQYEAQMKILDAKEEKNNASRFTLMGDMHQNQTQETGEIINTIMELKNQMVESVIQMLNASFSTRQQLMSAAMAR
ncbi:MAG: hypothetical protein ACAI38_24265 [Myxococcota bacterium]